MIHPPRHLRAVTAARGAAPAPSPARILPRVSGPLLGRRVLATGLGALMLTTTGLGAVAGAGVAQAATATVINNPPVGGHAINVFPQRDFVSASGYADGQLVTVNVVHPNGTVLTAGSGLAPQDDPRTAAFDGLVEINHPGGYCWQGTTPDIRPGDKVQVVDDATGVADETTVAGVTNGRPVQTAPDTVVVHGTAVQADGTTPIPVGQLEQRLVANRQAFDLNGTRTLRGSSVAARRAGGTLAYDAVDSTNWTATYSGLSAHDLSLALGAQTVGIWLGNPVGTAESTNYEVGAGIVAGPTAPCTAPLEVLPPPPGSELVPPSATANLTATVTNNNTVTLNWDAATDNVGVTSYGIYRDGTPIDNVQNADSSAPAPTAFVDKNVAPGTYIYTVDAADAVGNRGDRSNGAAAKTVANPAPAVAVNEPPVLPVSIISFPSRDFVSPSGFKPTDTVDIALIRDGKVISNATGQIPQDDDKTPGFDGLVEVNHPGGGCWAGVTPEIRPGDVVRTVAYGADGNVRTIDQTRTANVTATKVSIIKPASSATTKDGVVEITGTAVAPDGKPLPIGQIEQRLVANRDAFDATGKRTLRAGGAGGGDGTMSYDTTKNPLGINWTTRYAGLSSDDVYRAAGGTSLTGRKFAGAESRVLWLGVHPLTLQELTIFEVGLADPPGPVAGFCTAPLEAPDSAAPSVPTGVAATQAGANDVKISWTASTDDWYVAGYRVFRDGTAIGNVGGSYADAADSSSAFTVPTSFTDTTVPPGPHSYTVAAYDNGSPQGTGATNVEKVAAGVGKPYGNFSAESASASLTQADVTAPTVPGNVTAKVSGQDVALSWTASTDDVGVTAYRVYRRDAGTTPWTQLGSDVTSGTTATDAGVAPGSYEYTVDALDAAGNRSAKAGPPASVTVTPAADTTAPSDVTGLTATNAPDIHGRDVKVTWDAATDNVAVSGYGVYRDGVKIADVNAPSLSYTDVNRPTGTYKYTVDAVDSAGNRSATKPAALSVVVANDPPLAPHALIAFPARDFISATGYTPGAAYTFSLIRGNKVIATSTPIVADSTGLAEVNHPGGACWNTVTPDIQAGDVVRISSGGIAEQTTVAGVTAERPIVASVDAVTGGGTVEIHGTAQDTAGKPIPVDQLEQRLVANRDAFDLSGRRTVRAGGAGTDGTLTYDAAGSTRWTAKYTFQTPNDLARSAGGTSTSGAQYVGAESRVLWLGRSPLSLVESTIFENGAGVNGGPAAGIAGCTSGPAETPAAGAALSPAPTFATTAVGSTSAPQTVTLTNNGTAPLHVDRAYLAGLNPGDYTITANGANGATVAPGANVTVSVAFRPTLSGQRQANLSFADDAANTTDQSVALVASTPVAATPTATAPIQSLAGGTTIAVNATLANSTIPVDLRWSGTGTRSELQMATGSGPSTLGPFAAVPLTPDTATSTTVNLKMGSTAGTGYQFQVRSCNATTCGPWTSGPKFTLVAGDETNLAGGLFKGTWTSEKLAGSYGGSVRWATSGSATIVPSISFTVSGNAAWVSTLGPDRGLAQVQVDNGTPQVVDLYAATVQPARVVWARDALVAGNHTVTVTALGKKSSANPGACTTGTKCARVDVDAAVTIR